MHHTVADARDLKRAEFALPFRYLYPAIRLGFILACFQVFPYCRQKAGSPRLFDALKRLAIDAGRAAVPLGSTVSLFEGLGLRDMYEETPEAMRPIRLRLSIDPSPQILQADGWFCHLTPASLCRTAYSPVRALPSGRVLLRVHRQ